MFCFILVFSKFLVLVVKNQKKLEKTKKKANPSLLSPMRLFLLPEPLATWRNILFFLLCVFSSLGCGALGCDNVPCSCTHVRCSLMDCLGTYLTHVTSCDVTRVQSATQGTASVHT